MGSLAEFIAQLRETGVASLSGANWVQAGPLAAEVAKLDAVTRDEFPGEAPALELPAAAWAAELLHQACLAVVQREVSAEEAARWLAKPCPLPASPAVIYSADLLLRHLPELHQLARRLSARDPVTAGLAQLCGQWPYSSVGVANAGIAEGHPHLAHLAGHAGLRRAYVDRLFARGDLSRLGQNSLIDDELRAALGEYPDLAPAFATKLREG